MNHTWLKRLIRSNPRRKAKLQKARLSWPTVLQTGDQGRLMLLSSHQHTFPTTIKLKVTLRPHLVDHQDLQGKVIFEGDPQAPVFLYKDCGGDHQRVYGRCKSIDVILDQGPDLAEGSQLATSVGSSLYSKPFFHLASNVEEVQGVIDHAVVNLRNKRPTIYPYGGFLAPEGAVGDALFMTLSRGRETTHLRVFTYQYLRERGIMPGGANPKGYAFEQVDLTDRRTLLPLYQLIKEGDITSELSLQFGDVQWVQSYVSESFSRFPGTLKGELILRKQALPQERRGP